MGFTWQMDCHSITGAPSCTRLALGGAREWKRRLIGELRKRNTMATAGGIEGGTRWTSKTHRKKPHSAPRPAPSWKPTRNAASPARWKAIAAARMRPARWSAPSEFQRRKAEAGFVGIHWPKEWGGRGGTQIQNVIYNQEEAQFDVLTGILRHRHQPGPADDLRLRHAGAARTLRQADDARRDSLVPVVLRAVAAAPTSRRCARAPRRHGDEWVINGQKIWNSGAHYSDFGILVARSDPERAEARRADVLHSGHEDAGRGGAADPPALRFVALQRSVLHQRAHSRCDARRPGGRRLARRADHADERAARHARFARAGLRRTVPPGAVSSNWRTGWRSTTPRCRRSWRNSMSARRG